MQVERFFHIRTESNYGGATVRVTGDPEQVGQVDVQATVCSKKDPFCKKTGREMAIKAPIKVVPLRFLPKELQRIGVKAHLPRWQQPDWLFSIRYFLPKE